VVDLKVTLIDGSSHDVDSNEMAFKIAASMAFKEGMQKGKAVLQEPVMKVEVTVPEEYMGDVLGNLSSRRAMIEGMEARANAQVIRSMVPLAEMFGYATELRSMTQGLDDPGARRLYDGVPSLSTAPGERRRGCHEGPGNRQGLVG